MKTNFVKKIAACSLVCLGTVALGTSIIGCNSTVGNIDFTSNGEKVTSLNGFTGVEYTISASFTGESLVGGEVIPQILWTWDASKSESTTGLTISPNGSNLTFSAQNAGTYILSVSYMENQEVLGQQDFTFVATTPDLTKAIYALDFDEEKSNVVYRQGDTFSSENLFVYRTVTVDGTEVERVRLNLGNYSLSATVEGDTFPLEDGFMFETLGTYKVVISSDGADDVTFDLTVERGYTYEFTNIMREFSQQSDNFYVEGGHVYGMDDDILINYNTSVAYSVQETPTSLPGSEGQTITGLRKFGITEADESGNPTKATPLDLVWSTIYDDTGIGLGYFGNSKDYTAIEAFAQTNDFVLPSDFDMNAITEDGEVTYELVGTTAGGDEVYGYGIGANVTEFFLEFGGYGYVLNNYPTVGGYVVQLGDNTYQVLAILNVNGQGQILQVVFDYGNNDYSQLKASIDSFAGQAADQESLNDRILNDTLDVFANKGYQASHSEYNGTRVLLTVNDNYVTTANQTGGVLNEETGEYDYSRATTSNIKGFVKDTRTENTWNSYTISGDEITVDTQTSITDEKASIYDPGSYLGFVKGTDELLWDNKGVVSAVPDVIPGDDQEIDYKQPGTLTYEYSSYGNGAAMQWMGVLGFGEVDQNFLAIASYSAYLTLSVDVHVDNMETPTESEIVSISVYPTLDGITFTDNTGYDHILYFADMVFTIFDFEATNEVVEGYLSGLTNTQTL